MGTARQFRSVLEEISLLFLKFGGLESIFIPIQISFLAGLSNPF